MDRDEVRRRYSDEFSLGIWEGENVKYACFLEVVHLQIRVCVHVWLGNIQWGTREKNVTEGERLRRRQEDWFPLQITHYHNQSESLWGSVSKVVEVSKLMYQQGF